jgi:hypothetical protein
MVMSTTDSAGTRSAFFRMAQDDVDRFWEAAFNPEQPGLRQFVADAADEIFSEIRAVQGRPLKEKMKILRVTDFDGSDLRHADLAGEDLSGISFIGADLRHANLAGADLSNADLSNSLLHGTKLGGANMAGTRLAGARGQIPLSESAAVAAAAAMVTWLGLRWLWAAVRGGNKPTQDPASSDGQIAEISESAEA